MGWQRQDGWHNRWRTIAAKVEAAQWEDVRWAAAAIVMDGGRVIVMDGSSGDGQRRRYGQRDSGVIAMGNGTKAV
jgi:hypothetical protein